MKTKVEILKVMKQELPHLKEKFKVKDIGLFGSYAREEQSQTRDIDVLVDFEVPVGFFKFIELEDYLSNKLGVKVDLVTPDALKPLIKTHIMQEAVYVG